MELEPFDDRGGQSCLIGASPRPAQRPDRRGRPLGYRNSTLYTLKYVAEMLDEDEEFLRDCSIGMFSEDGCLSAYDDYHGSELSEAIVVFTEDGIENLRYIVEERRAAGNAPPKPTAEGRRPKS